MACVPECIQTAMMRFGNEQTWTGGELDVLWFDGIDHGGFHCPSRLPGDGGGRDELC
jgi:hypothetical protein